ncbi:hypothetical protein DFS34DRAFT_382395 [Phlyctochytrium arcticum]|nr:hypothetical protein DFS34DRAFT_382395 [Phlyctochytrium arcticum]
MREMPNQALTKKVQQYRNEIARLKKELQQLRTDMPELAAILQYKGRNDLMSEERKELNLAYFCKRLEHAERKGSIVLNEENKHILEAAKLFQKYYSAVSDSFSDETEDLLMAIMKAVVDATLPPVISSGISWSRRPSFTPSKTLRGERLASSPRK